MQTERNMHDYNIQIPWPKFSPLDTLSQHSSPLPFLLPPAAAKLMPVGTSKMKQTIFTRIL